MSNLKSIVYDPEKIFENGRRISLAESLISFFKEVFNFLFPFLNAIFNSNKKQYEQLRQIFSFSLGTIYGILIYYFTIYQLDQVSESMNAILFSFILVVVSFMMTFNKESRCLMTLSTFNFVSSASKVILTSYIIANLLNGPVENTFNNLIELTESVRCQYELSKNISAEIKAKPKKEANMSKVILDSQADMNQVNKDMYEMIDATEQVASGETNDSIR
jgi:hypothetical protein